MKNTQPNIADGFCYMKELRLSGKIKTIINSVTTTRKAIIVIILKTMSLRLYQVGVSKILLIEYE